MAALTFLDSIILFLLQYVIALPAIALTAPFAQIYDFFSLYHPHLFRAANTPAKHAKKVADVQAQVIKWNKNGRKGRMCTSRPDWKTVSIRNYEKKGLNQIHMDLEEIIEVDTRNKVLRVEPGIKMGTLIAQLIPQGWTIPVVPEYRLLTVGGCICGAGLETSSFKYGMFADTPIEYEVILADGSLIKASKTENSDIYYGMHWSHGTIGFLVGVTFPLVKVGKYVELEYIPTTSLEEAQKLFHPSSDLEFVEGLAFDKSKIVVMHGKFTDSPASPSKINSIERWYKPLFFKHVESFLSKPAGRHVEYIPTQSYYIRHDRALFWGIYILLPYANNPLFRLLFGWVLPINPALVKRFTPIAVVDAVFKRDNIAQDFVLPLSKFKKSMEFSHQTVQVYPLWLCPVILSPIPGMTHSTGPKKEMFIDIGIYGQAQKSLSWTWTETVRKFEKFTIENKGFQGLYADNFLTKEEFGQMFDMTLYNEVRKKYNCSDAFPHTYDKVSYIARKQKL